MIILPFYTPKFSVSEFTGSNGILASEHLEYLVAGATLDATAFSVGAQGAGKLIARNLTSGKFEPFTAVEGFDNFSVLEYGFTNDGVNDLIAGSVIVKGVLYEAKLADVPTDEFKAVTPMIQYASHK